MASKRKLVFPAIHPGEILTRYCNALDWSGRKLGRELRLSTDAISSILRGKRRLNADLCLRLGKLFKTGPEYWLELQNAYDIAIAYCKIGKDLDKIKPVTVSLRPTKSSELE